MSPAPLDCSGDVTGAYCGQPIGPREASAAPPASTTPTIELAAARFAATFSSACGGLVSWHLTDKRYERDSGRCSRRDGALVLLELRRDLGELIPADQDESPAILPPEHEHEEQLIRFALSQLLSREHICPDALFGPVAGLDLQAPHRAHPILDDIDIVSAWWSDDPP